MLQANLSMVCNMKKDHNDKLNIFTKCWRKKTSLYLAVTIALSYEKGLYMCRSVTKLLQSIIVTITWKCAIGYNTYWVWFLQINVTTTYRVRSIIYNQKYSPAGARVHQLTLFWLPPSLVFDFALTYKRKNYQYWGAFYANVTDGWKGTSNQM